MPLGQRPQAERFDKGGFSHARHPGNTQAHGAPGMRKQIVQQSLGHFSMVGARGFNQGNGAGQGAALARQNTCRQILGRQSWGCHGYLPFRLAAEFLVPELLVLESLINEALDGEDFFASGSGS